MSSVTRSLKVIELIAGATNPPTHAELARRLGIPKGTLSQLLTHLRHAAYVVEVDGRYHVGVQLISLSHRLVQKDGATLPVKLRLDRLAREAGETALLAVRVKDKFMYIAQSLGPSPIGHAVDLGRAISLETTAIGRVFLAYDDVLSENIPSALSRALTEVRRHGYAVSEGDFMASVHGIAAPVLGAANHPVIAAVEVLGPKMRMRDMRERIWPMLRRTTQEIYSAIDVD